MWVLTIQLKSTKKCNLFYFRFIIQYQKEIKWKNTLGTKFTAISSPHLTPLQDGVTAVVSSIKPSSTLADMQTPHTWMTSGPSILLPWIGLKSKLLVMSLLIDRTAQWATMIKITELSFTEVAPQIKSDSIPYIYWTGIQSNGPK